MLTLRILYIGSANFVLCNTSHVVQINWRSCYCSTSLHCHPPPLSRTASLTPSTRCMCTPNVWPGGAAIEFCEPNSWEGEGTPRLATSHRPIGDPSTYVLTLYVAPVGGHTHTSKLSSSCLQHRWSTQLLPEQQLLCALQHIETTATGSTYVRTYTLKVSQHVMVASHTYLCNVHTYVRTYIHHLKPTATKVYAHTYVRNNPPTCLPVEPPPPPHKTHSSPSLDLSVSVSYAV